MVKIKTNDINTTGSSPGQVLQVSSGSVSWTTLTKSDVGLSNIDNTSDINKPISTATQSALDLKLDIASAFSGSYNDLADTPSLFDGAFSSLTGKPTTLSGYGITDAVNTGLLGVTSGVATLDGSGKVPSGQLPSYVDDVEEYADYASLPVTGETGKIYITLDDNAIYRWSGSVYVEITSAVGTTDDITEGSTNLYFTQTRARSAISVTQNLTYDSGTGVITGPNLSSYATIVSLATVATTGDYDDLINKPTLSTNLSELGDVTLTSVSDGDTLTYDSGTSKWVNSAYVPPLAYFDAIQATGTGSSQDITLPSTGYTTNNVIVSINGLIMETDQYSITDDTLTLTTNYSGDSIEVRSAVVGTGGATTLNGLNDVTITAPSTDQFLRYDGSGWVNATFSPGASAIDDLTDVTITTPSNNQVLQYDGSAWINATLSLTTNLDSLTDVTLTSPASSEYLKYNGTAWANSVIDYSDIDNTPSIPVVISDLTDVTITSASDGQILKYSSGTLVNANFNDSLPSLTGKAGLALLVNSTEDDVEWGYPRTLTVTTNNSVSSYTLVLSDAYIRSNNTSAHTITVPPESSVNFPIGTQITIMQRGTGQVTIQAGAGVTLLYFETLTTRKQGSVCSLIKVDSDAWDVFGDMVLA